MTTRAVFLALATAMMHAQSYPPSPRKPVTETLHGVSFTDPYRWLEDQNSAETRAWVDAQIEYTRSQLDPIAGRDALRKRLNELMRTDKLTAPRVHGGRLFYTKRTSAATRWSICYRDSAGGPEQVLVDPEVVTRDEMSSVSIEAVSPDGRLLAYGIRAGGADERVVRFMNLDTGQHLAAELPASRYTSMRIAASRDLVYYTDLPNTGPRVFRRPLKDAQAQPEQLFGQEFGDKYSAEIDLTADGRYLVVNVSEGWTRGWVHLLDLTRGEWAVLGRELDAVTEAKAGRGELFLKTSWNAPKGRIFRVDCTKPQRHFWKLIVPESRDALENYTPAGGRLVLAYIRDAWSVVRTVDRDGGNVAEVGLKPYGSAGLGGSDWGEKEIYVSFVSFTAPSEFHRLDTRTGKLTAWAKETVPFDDSGVEVKQVWYTSKDGTKVPMFVAAKKGLAQDGGTPALIYGYGGFSVSVQPLFSATWAAWIENGGVLAVTNLRGGAEFGEAWHKAGMLANKQNVFDDFIAAAEWLIANRYTSADRLAIQGGSNGGLLVGAAMMQRPELYRAVLCAVPLLDMLRYHKFLLGPLWTPEYGSAADAAQFEYIRKYSPYQNFKAGVNYPAVMFKTGDADTRVAPLHARKMAALMQQAAAPGRPVLLHYDTKVGHSTGLPVTKEIDDGVDVLAFLMSQTGLAAAPAAR
ncbi:MAG: S9 family peptidase [Candidatus Solibacter sp.]|nr:S9 family peptidase [Candidatus Solibacter sp.]